jgi:hypothetical protein
MSGGSGCLSRSDRETEGGEARCGGEGGAAGVACVFPCFTLFCLPCLLYFLLGSRRRVAVGGVGDGETGSKSL